MKTLTHTALLEKNMRVFDPARTVEYFGMVNYATTERVIEEIRNLYRANPAEPVVLCITSAGGPSGIAMGFYDHMRSVLKPNLITVGSGDVDSSGVILLVAGATRYVTRNTTMLLHPAGGTFEENRRYTALEMDASLREYRLKDFQYASVIAENSRGSLTAEKVLELMERHTILTPTDLLSYGLVDAVLP